MESIHVILRNLSHWGIAAQYIYQQIRRLKMIQISLKKQVKICQVYKSNFTLKSQLVLLVLASVIQWKFCVYSCEINPQLNTNRRGCPSLLIFVALNPVFSGDLPPIPLIWSLTVFLYECTCIHTLICSKKTLSSEEPWPDIKPMQL